MRRKYKRGSAREAKSIQHIKREKVKNFMDLSEELQGSIIGKAVEDANLEQLKVMQETNTSQHNGR